MGKRLLLCLALACAAFTAFAEQRTPPPDTTEGGDAGPGVTVVVAAHGATIRPHPVAR